jgi:hypothetical protein
VGRDGCVGDRRSLTDLMMPARRNIRAEGWRLDGVSES